jgi:rare lipoprotein A
LRARARRTFVSDRTRSPTPVRAALPVFIVVLAAATLAGCAQSSIFADKPTARAARRDASLFPFATRSVVAARPVRGREQWTRAKPAATPRDASHGTASYYWQGSKTASGEKFDAREFTAAHPSLPFGTRVRVTNVSTGQSVTVRVNDRGPFVGKRVIDLSYSAAESLGMVRSGVAKVKLDVVQ